MRTIPENRTAKSAETLLRCISDSPAQSAALLAALAGAALTSPVMAVACAAAGCAFLARKRTPRVGILGGGALPGMKAPVLKEWELHHIGWHAETGEALRMTNDSMRQHFLILGNPGQRAPILRGMAESLVARGSGLVHVDARGNVDAFRGMSALACKHGRLDDVLLLDLTSGGPRRGHTFNPLSRGSSDNLTQMLVGLMPDIQDGAMWKGRATSLLAGLMKALVWARENGTGLKPSDVLANLSLATLIEIQAGIGRWEGIPDEIRVSVRAYLTSLPSYDEARGERQSQSTRDHHAYLSDFVAAMLTPLATDYASVFEHDLPQIDLTDVVLRRRILVVLLPPDGQERLSLLGRVVTASIRGMMGAALGNRIEGSWSEIVDNRDTNAPTPFLCLLDDVGDYMVEGTALMAAQARSLGFAMAYAADDIPSMKIKNEREAASVIANTNAKLFLDGLSHDDSATGTLLYKDLRIPVAMRPPWGERHSAAARVPADLLPLRYPTREEATGRDDA